MNYWPAEVGNLSEFAEPLFTMIRELSDQGSQVAWEHYGKKGWVFHQNTDLWRVAAPMDGVQWGTFTAGGAWLCTHLWEHFLYTGDEMFLKNAYPLLKGNVEFFLDYLTEHPKYGWLVTCPSTSPENYPNRSDNIPFFDEVLGREYTTTICAGSTIDMQLLKDLFGYVAEATEILSVDQELKEQLLAKREKLAPMQTGQNGDLREWLEDWPQREGGHHRHISHLYGLFPGNQISARLTPEWVEPAKVVLNERGLTGNGWASAWKMACWARLYEAGKAVEHFNYYVHNYCFNSLFAICSGKFQVDGSFGVSAAVAEMLIQSHEKELHLLPTLPVSWNSGNVSGLCARGGFEVDMEWEKGRLISAKILSKLGRPCRIRVADPVEVYSNGNKVDVSTRDGYTEFQTKAKEHYVIRAL
jgi:alpha-L-fucosidase 2